MVDTLLMSFKAYDLLDSGEKPIGCATAASTKLVCMLLENDSRWSQSEVNEEKPNMRKQVKKALPNALKSNGIGDANTALAPLVVHPERIVVPLRTQGSRKR
jgi:hypothetical protein